MRRARSAVQRCGTARGSGLAVRVGVPAVRDGGAAVRGAGAAVRGSGPSVGTSGAEVGWLLGTGAGVGWLLGTGMRRRRLVRWTPALRSARRRLALPVRRGGRRRVLGRHRIPRLRRVVSGRAGATGRCGAMRRRVVGSLAPALAPARWRGERVVLALGRRVGHSPANFASPRALSWSRSRAASSWGSPGMEASVAAEAVCNCTCAIFILLAIGPALTSTYCIRP